MESKSSLYGKWGQKGVPHKGWFCIGIEDLGKISQTCQMCEIKKIRYVHYMEHPKYDDILEVGCNCAGRMEEDLVGAQNRDKNLKNSAQRRKNWLRRVWKISKSGNEYINVDGFNIVIFYKFGKWNYIMKRISTNESEFSKRKYKTADEAKLAAFDYLIFLNK